MLARLKQARNDPNGATERLQEAKRLATGYGNEEAVARIGAWQARLWTAQENRWAAARWAQKVCLGTDELSYRSEFEHITLVRVFLGQGEPR